MTTKIEYLILNIKPPIFCEMFSKWLRKLNLHDTAGRDTVNRKISKRDHGRETLPK